MRFSRTVLLSILALCGTTLCACAHTSADAIQPPAKEHGTMTSTNSKSASTSELSADEIGKRFLKLIGALKSSSDLNPEHVNEVIGVRLEHFNAIPGQRVESFAYSQLLRGDWSYEIQYLPSAAMRSPGVSLDFVHKSDRYAAMTDICQLSFEDYHNAMKAMGFGDAPNYGELGQLIDWRYHKDGMTVSIASRPEVTALDGKKYRACVTSISTVNE